MQLPHTWKIKSSTPAFENQWLNVRKDICEIPGQEGEYDWYVVERADVGGVIAFTEDKKVLMNYQYRHGIQEVVLEMPLGAIDEGERPQEGSLRELEEETGYQIHGDVVELPKLRPNPGLQPETLHLFLGFDAQPTGTREDHPTEEIVNVLVTIDELEAKIQAGEIPSMWAVAGWQLAKAWLQEHKPEMLQL